MRDTNRHLLWRLAGIGDHRRRQLDLGNVVEVEWHRRFKLSEQFVDRPRIAGRMGFERDAVALRHSRRQAQLLHHHVLNTAAAVVDKLKPLLTQRVQVVHTLVFRVGW